MPAENYLWTAQAAVTTVHAGIPCLFITGKKKQKRRFCIEEPEVDLGLPGLLYYRGNPRVFSRCELYFAP